SCAQEGRRVGRFTTPGRDGRGDVPGGEPGRDEEDSCGCSRRELRDEGAVRPSQGGGGGRRLDRCGAGDQRKYRTGEAWKLPKPVDASVGEPVDEHAES